MDKENHKQGLSVREIENLGKKYRFEIFFILYFMIAAIFSGVFFGMGWSIYLGALGGILGIFMPKKAESVVKKLFGFVFKQEQVTRLVLACCGLIVAFFAPPLVFFVLGFVGGANMYNTARSSSNNTLPPA